MRRNLEVRSFETGLRARSGSARTLVGHAAVFDTWTDIGWFKEKIERGAFTDTIANDDIRALFNHDSNVVLGRNVAKTLRLSEDDKGLAVEIDMPDTQAAKDLMVSVERGDVSQMSFGFRTESDVWGTENSVLTRIVKKAKLYDVSPVTFPAYPTTDVSARIHGASELLDEDDFDSALLSAIDPASILIGGIDLRSFDRLLAKCKRGVRPTAAELEILRSAQREMQEALRVDAGRARA